MFWRKVTLRSKTKERDSRPSIPSNLSSVTFTVNWFLVMSEKTDYDLVGKQTCSAWSKNSKTKTMPADEQGNSISQVSH